MNITQTVEIPASHRLTIDVPREVPAGPVILTFTPAKAAPAVTRAETPAPAPMAPEAPVTVIFPHERNLTPEQIREERLQKFWGGHPAKDAAMEQRREEALKVYWEDTKEMAASVAREPDRPTPHTDFLSGILAGAGDLTDEQIREERLMSRYMQ